MGYNPQQSLQNTINTIKVHLRERGTTVLVPWFYKHGSVKKCLKLVHPGSLLNEFSPEKLQHVNGCFWFP